MTLVSFYAFCFLIGLGFAVISAILTGISDIGSAHTDLSHAEVGSDAGGTVDSHLPSGDHNVAHISPLSPVTVSVFATAFGGTGLVWNKLLQGHLQLIGFLLAVISGFVIAACVFYLFYKIFSVTQGSSEVKQEDLIGLDARVTVTIPASSVGEITYTAAGRRYTAAARSTDGVEIPKDTDVMIIKIENNIFFVEPR